MNAPMSLTAAAVAYARAKEELIAATGMDEDDECLQDTLEGVSELPDLIVSALREAQRAEAFAKAMDTIIKNNQARKARYKAKNDTIRMIVAKAMKEATIPTIRALDMTISSTKKDGGPRITNEDLLPDWAKSEETVYVPNVAAIRAAWEANKNEFVCAGVEIAADEPSIRVVTK